MKSVQHRLSDNPGLPSNVGRDQKDMKEIDRIRKQQEKEKEKGKEKEKEREKGKEKDKERVKGKETEKEREKVKEKEKEREKGVVGVVGGGANEKPNIGSYFNVPVVRVRPFHREEWEKKHLGGFVLLYPPEPNVSVSGEVEGSGDESDSDGGGGGEKGKKVKKIQMYTSAYYDQFILSPEQFFAKETAAFRARFG
jgi:hypothetical protein